MERKLELNKSFMEGRVPTMRFLFHAGTGHQQGGLWSFELWGGVGETEESMSKPRKIVRYLDWRGNASKFSIEELLNPTWETVLNIHPDTGYKTINYLDISCIFNRVSGMRHPILTFSLPLYETRGGGIYTRGSTIKEIL